ncbi:MAG TPA: HAD-IIB family hydrolase [Chloroflexota bacterium]|nr:HAD-IIB family hydrolase [Chloroflexota bacterium]
MDYCAIASDYDGTLGFGTVGPATIAALRRWREAGHAAILVTGRRLQSILEALDCPDVFDRIVAEDGAVLYRPAGAEVHLLAPPPPAALLEALDAENLRGDVGEVVIGARASHREAIERIIRDLGLTHHLTYNKEWAMVLPEGVDKAYGLAAALDEMGIAAEETVAVGDAENDLPLLRLAGLGVAVANAISLLKEEAAWVTAGEAGEGVVEMIDTLLAPAGKTAAARSR